MGAMSAAWQPFSMATIAGLDGDDGFAGADIALQQAAHGLGAAHVGDDFGEHALLRGGGMEGQHLLDGLADAGRRWRRRCRLAPSFGGA